MVGCVLLRDGETVGEGWPPARRRSARGNPCVARSGRPCRGATAYVTAGALRAQRPHRSLRGRADRCGRERVIAAMRDPFPQVDGRWLRRLRAAGIAVECGLLEAQARWLNRGFLSRLERGRPWLRVKLASSLDGRTALANGDSKWMRRGFALGRAALARARRRHSHGSGTVLADDPSLTVRGWRMTRLPGAAARGAGPRLGDHRRGRVREGDAPTLYLHAPNAKRRAGFQSIARRCRCAMVAWILAR